MYKNILITILIVLLFSKCKKEEFTPEYEINFKVEIKQNNFVDTLYNIILVDVSSGDNEIVENGQIDVIHNNKIIFSDDWENLKNKSFSFSERERFKLEFELKHNNIVIDTEYEWIENTKFPDYIKITRINIDYDLSEIQYSNNPYANIITAHSYLSLDNDNTEGYVTYYSKFFTPYLNTYIISNMFLSTTDEKFDEYWMKYEIRVGYPRGNASVFIDYRYFNITIDIIDIIDNNHLNTDSIYSFTALDGNSQIVTIDYKPIYNE